MNFTIHSVLQLDVTPETLSFSVDTTDVGQIAPVINEEGRYSLANNALEQGMILVSCDEDFPNSSTMEVTCEPILGMISNNVNLNTVPQPLLINIPFVETAVNHPNGLEIGYQYMATETMAPQTFTRVVTFTATAM